ncbi:hypothetical protein, partial [Sphingobium sp. YR657]|uniref:hypothetical protein n=1 Tax=Sphingobium sp. YR657 TaxID=1884366 RepID=UPI001C31D5E8
ILAVRRQFSCTPERTSRFDLAWDIAAVPSRIRERQVRPVAVMRHLPELNSGMIGYAGSGG